uniref:protein-glutamine gamma-glutamyltransferase n=1 Tax=Mola mola TaxID=94237 RepID=A0A3Q3XGQ2_MOLML
FPEFEPFDQATPRGEQPTGGGVMGIDMCQPVNKPQHNTSAYDITHLVIRRGQPFTVIVTFDRQLAESDDFQLEFLIGSNPSANKGSLVVVTFGNRPGSQWAGQIERMDGTAAVLMVTPAPDAIVGKYRTYVAIATGGGMQRTSRDTSTDLYLLFNAWCPDDTVFIPNESERSEYVLNDSGVIYQGAAGAVSHRTWMYGQFEKGVLDACIYILDASRMPIYDRGNIIKLIRIGSAMINAQDDNGVLVGNWSEDYSMGTAPTAWTGSVKILLQYANTGVPVCFAQCWVFAGVFNTFLRCLGIPARVISNFNSAHDNTGNLKTDLIFKTDGTPDRRNTRDSIWNYHCWNEVFILRPDLPSGLGGWQVVDATPQETSDGHFRCGPASVAAIKDGLICHPFDSGFVFAEVNSDVVFHKRDKYGTLTPYKVDKTHVGVSICTKSLGSTAPTDITYNYKYPEGSEEDERTMDRAEDYGCARDHSEVSEGSVTVVMITEEVYMGQDILLEVEFQNVSDLEKVVNALLSGSVIYYTGVIANDFKEEAFSVIIPGKKSEQRVHVCGTAQYMPHLGSQPSLHFMVTGETDTHSLSCMKVVNLKTPELTMAVSGFPRVQHPMLATVSFTNPFNFSLRDVYLSMEGSGLMECRSYSFRYALIEPFATVSWRENFSPRLHGDRFMVAVLYCPNMPQVTSSRRVF